MPSQQDLLDRAGATGQHLLTLHVDVYRAVSPLVQWSAFNAGIARLGAGVVESLKSKDRWEELQRVLSLDSYDLAEAGAVSVAAATVQTSLDLAAAAALRIAGAVPPWPNGREFHWGSMRPKFLGPHPLTPALEQWRADLEASPDRQLLWDVRTQVVHRTTPRNIFLSSGADRLPISEVVIDGGAYAVDDLVPRLVAFGERTFLEFCDAVDADLPLP